MKKIVLFLTFIALLPFVNNTAQTEFAPVGATWWYDYYTSGGDYFLYYEITGKKTINGLECKVLNRKIIGYNTFQQALDTSNLSDLYLFTDNDSVLVWSDSVLHFLFDFSVEPNTIWQVQENDFTVNLNCVNSGEIIIDSVQTKWLQNDSLKYIYNQPYNGDSLALPNPLIEKIGGISDWFPLINGAECGLASWGTGLLRCYKDADVSFSFLDNEPCDYLDGFIGIKPLKDYKTIDVYPNPFVNQITVLIYTTSTLILYDSQGKVLKKIPEYSPFEMVDLKNLTNGIYYLKIINEKHSKTLKLFKQ